MEDIASLLQQLQAVQQQKATVSTVWMLLTAASTGQAVFSFKIFACNTLVLLFQVRLSERNVVELVNKLYELNILQRDELLHTMSGKEFITIQRLRAEVEAQLAAHGGRLALVRKPPHTRS